MTGQAFVQVLRVLVQQGQYQEARALVLTHGTVALADPRLTRAELVALTDMLAVVDQAAEALDGLVPTAVPAQPAPPAPRH